MKVFISYAWEEEHNDWVRDLATRLRSDGIDVTLDRWALAPGDQLSEFMEKAVRENEFVVVICTPKYKVRSDNREGGVGYEGDIMTAEVLTTKNRRKFVPVLRSGEWKYSAPTWLVGSLYVDLSEPSKLEENYPQLRDTLLGRTPAPPPLGPIAPISQGSSVGTSSASNPKQELYINFVTSALNLFRLFSKRQRQMAAPGRKVLSAVSLPITEEIKAASRDLQDMFERISLQGSSGTCKAAQGMVKNVIMADAWSMTATKEGKKNVGEEHKKMLGYRDEFLSSARAELGLDPYSVQGAEE